MPPSSRHHTATQTRTHVSTRAFIGIASGTIIVAFAVLNFAFEDRPSSMPSPSAQSCFQSCSTSFSCNNTLNPTERNTCTTQLQTCQQACRETRRIYTQEDAPLSIVTGGLPEAHQARPWELRFSGVGGSGSYRWTLLSEPIPGMRLSPEGTLSGTPSVSGARTVRVRLEDLQGGHTIERDFVLNILSQNVGNLPPSFIQVGPYPDGKVDEPYHSHPFVLAGGLPPYRWNIASGRLPDGLSLGTNGEVSGVPRQAGTFSFVARASDARNQTVQADRHIRILDAQTYETEHRTYEFAPNQVSFSDQELNARLDALKRLKLNVHDLLKLPDDGNIITQNDSTVYYIGADGRRHAFPNPYVYRTWYIGYGQVRIVSPQVLNAIPVGANITYRPGVRLVKFIGSPQIYVVDSGRRLRTILSGGIGEALYGMDWVKIIDDIPDVFYTDYLMGDTVTTPNDFAPSFATEAASTPSDILP